MSRFYTSNINSRGTLNGRIVKAGSDVHTRGWDAGVKVVPVGVKGERDKFLVYMTPGSHANGRDVLLGTVHDTENGPVFVAAGDELPDAADSATMNDIVGFPIHRDSSYTGETAHYTPGHP